MTGRPFGLLPPRTAGEYARSVRDQPPQTARESLMDRSFTESIRHESAPESALFALSPVVAQPDSFIVGRRLSVSLTTHARPLSPDPRQPRPSTDPLATVIAERLGYPPETALTLGRFVAGSSARWCHAGGRAISHGQERTERAGRDRAVRCSYAACVPTKPRSEPK
jgi:hypothetical protein